MRFHSTHVTIMEAGRRHCLNLIAGLEEATQGTIGIDDVDIASLSSDAKTVFRGKHISFVFQQFHLLPQLTVRENVDLVIELNNLERRFRNRTDTRGK